MCLTHRKCSIQYMLHLSKEVNIRETMLEAERQSRGSCSNLRREAGGRNQDTGCWVEEKRQLGRKFGTSGFWLDM